MTQNEVQISERYPDKDISLSDVKQLMKNVGCHSLIVKELAWNHDSKRQIYLIGSTSIFNTFPCKIENNPPMPHWMQKSQKKKMSQGQNRFYGHLDYEWITINGDTETAKHAKIIFYPQYPEARLSGFLRGIKSIPSKYLREKSGEVYTNRILFLGISNTGHTIAFLTVGHGNLREELKQTEGYDTDAGLNSIPLFNENESPETRLLDQLTRIHSMGWIEGKRLSADGLKPCYTPNAVGYTLEAELGILPNGDNAPDFMGWEVKAHTVTDWNTTGNKVVTLFTPEPDCGVYQEEGIRTFIERWGYPDRNGKPDRHNFGGIYRLNTTNDLTGLTLRIEGFNAETQKLDANGHLGLYSPEGYLASGWTFKKLIDCWRRKHAATAYVPAQRNKEDKVHCFHYGNEVMLCEGADFVRVLNAVTSGALYLDPALKAENWSSDKPRFKKRNQFRIKMKDVPSLYNQSKVQTLQEAISTA
ncbi:MvaI/BcnI family restriction endonuclease [Poriferisphaera sp. WC338]|uniref:MvaI/BcnI family restriction endonuclease n=1 Tax=Poriferisphaera sp. WC338 TaxID=3425129 RepID=UPI003D813F71